MDTYYEDILRKVGTLTKDAQFAEAYAILDGKLFIPYIPREYGEPLIAYYNQCRSECKRRDTAVREEDIETLLKGSPEEAFPATEQLKKSSIHNHMGAVAGYLSQNPHYLVRSLMTEAMMEQSITNEINADIDGPEVTFSPCSLDAPMESERTLEAVNYLKDWFENDNPAFAMMYVETLVKEAYLRLPFNIEEDEALPLVAAMTAYVFHTYEEHEAWMLSEEEKGLAQYRGYELSLRKHEM